MASGPYPFIDIAVLDPVRTRFAAGDALLLMGADLKTVLWANGPGAAFAGLGDIEAALGAEVDLGAVTRRQIMSVPGYPRMEGESAIGVRAWPGVRTGLVQLLLSTVTLPDGGQAVLIAAPAAEAGNGPQRAIGGFTAEGYHTALVDGDGHVAAASARFEELGVSQETLARLVEEAGTQQDRLVKRMIDTDTGRLPAGFARLTDDPALHFLLVVADGAQDGEVPAADEPEFDEGPLYDGRGAKAPAAGAAPVAGPAEAEPGHADIGLAAPVRFVWRTDADGRFSAMGEEFVAAAGSSAAGVLGETFSSAAARLGIDPSGEIAGLLERRDTWSGRTVLWPLSGSDLVVPVDLAALPVYGRGRVFEGFRGFGVARMGEARFDPQRRGLSLDGGAAPMDEPRQEAAESAPAPAGNEAQPAPEDSGADEAAQIITLAEHRPAPVPTLSNAERNALREIRERLRQEGVADAETPTLQAVLTKEQAGEVAAEPDADEPVLRDDAGEDTPETPAVPVTEEAPVEGAVEDEAEDAVAEVAAAEPDAGVPLLRDGAEEDIPETPAPLSTEEVPVEDEAEDVVAADLPAGAETADAELEEPDEPAEQDVPVQGEAHVKPPSLLSMLPDEEPDTEVEKFDPGPLPDHVHPADARREESAVGADVPGIAQDNRRLSGGDDHAPAIPTSGFVPSAFYARDAEARGVDTTILARLPVPILIHAGDVLHYANREFLRLTGYANLGEFEAAGGLDAIFADPYEERETDRQDGRKLKLRSREGEEFPVDAHLQRVPWKGGQALLLALQRAGVEQPDGIPAPDLRQPARAELEERIAEMRAIIDTATDGVVVIDNDGLVRSISRPAEALFGIDSDDIAGEPFTQLFAIESQRAARDYLNGLSDNGVASVLNDGREVIGREAQGRFIPLFMTIGRLPNRSGYCAVVRDITQWKRAEEELTQARAQAERSSSQKTDFLARVSHEIRTPLNAIIGFSELMMDEKFGPIGNDRYRDYLHDINRSGNHVLDLVNDLLDISKIEAGEQEMAYEAVSLNDVLAETVAMMQPQANRDRVIIRSSFASRLPEVVADLRSVRQIALNLMSNAIRYTQAGGQVIVSTSYEPTGDIVMRIRDTGIGMSSAEIDQALKPFKQVNALKRQRGDGTGLGLPLTKAMVEANRARFAISSTPAVGTLVEITFPSTRVLAE